MIIEMVMEVPLRPMGINIVDNGKRIEGREKE
jgi:hypothetical protein